MRCFLVLACCLAVVVPGVVAQEAERDYDLEEYAVALKRFCNGRHEKKDSAKITRLINLAMLDRTLGKAPTVRAQTANALRKVDELGVIARKAAREQDALSSKIGDITGGEGANTPQKFERMGKLQNALKEAEKAEEEQRLGVRVAMQESINQIKALASTPEGQQFSMPADSAFLEEIDPKSTREPRVIKGSTRFEVMTVTPEGFFGYEMKVDKTTEPVDGKRAGEPKQDANGNYLYVADSTKNVFIRGYTKPVRTGMVVQIKVTPGEVKEINGARVKEFTFVAE